ncbi:unnamed protein product [Trichobilharzia regenti]|nr:unnamed protein product [Trichobilharzia regenti]
MPSNPQPNFIDFEMAFDSVDREVIWKLLRYYGVPKAFDSVDREVIWQLLRYYGVPLIIHLIQQLYDNAACQVIHNGKISPHPTVIRQCCMPSNPQRETYGSLIQQLYDNAACQVIHNGKLTEAFEVRTQQLYDNAACQVIHNGKLTESFNTAMLHDK